MNRENRILEELEKIRMEIGRIAPYKPLASEEAKKLPSYFKDNPWIEVLAKRGEEPEF